MFGTLSILLTLTVHSYTIPILNFSSRMDFLSLPGQCKILNMKTRFPVSHGGWEDCEVGKQMKKLMAFLCQLTCRPGVHGVNALRSAGQAW